MSGLDDLYRQIILDHSKQAHGRGIDAAPAPEGTGVGSSHQINPTCGDEITLRLALDGDRIAQVRWDGMGCSISMASASVLTELAKDMDVDGFRAAFEEFRGMMRSRDDFEEHEETLGDAAAFAGVSRYPARVKCAMLAWVAAEHALAEAH
ncbi:Fe-S cluster assembly sulfur transfer protein SufU [Herbiconiux sp. L3-i23]|uniref:Fe-S cluster assembly sulfur transfer protein SufU n=1 Tax=Herbiconiux sp. L3-i23 TaxID=2905871 RepID=UPI00206DD2E6|nr:SUF system NifU family Fe-S cluster assembly protein [Herbiconiux sp. L3-i23]BDI23210.1 iron-sulfur cluster assembly scaffold protein NifU [Herbiconiux sp. L3-i23]